jgi:hypothetical protein
VTSLFNNPMVALAVGIGAAAALLAVWLGANSSDTIGLISFLARLAHVGAAMLWVGMIWFVNFIQIIALQETDDVGRAVLMRSIVPRVARVFRGASHVVLASGGVLLLTTGYVLDRWVFPSAVYIPTARGIILWIGVLAGLAMWWLVNRMILPSLKSALDPKTSDGERELARYRMRAAARINLALSIPTTFAMIAAAHLY